MMRSTRVPLWLLLLALYLPFWVRVCTRIGSMWGGRGGLTWA